MNPTRTSLLLMERRQSGRAPANLSGTIRMQDRAMRCTIVDLSASGAGLKTDSAGEHPSAFLLEIDGRDEIWQCRKVWSSGDRLGVSFEHQVQSGRNLGTA